MNNNLPKLDAPQSSGDAQVTELSQEVRYKLWQVYTFLLTLADEDQLDIDHDKATVSELDACPDSTCKSPDSGSAESETIEAE